MDVIVSHVNLDFDGLASLLAAKKLHPDARVALTDKQHPTVKSFLAIYRDELAFSSYNDINWKEVQTLILVDVASLKRTGIPILDLPPNVQTIVYDHHSPKDGDLSGGERYIEPVGATVTFLVEKLCEYDMSITPFEATLYGLGLYTDTGNFTYQQTTERDLYIAAFLKQKKMDISLVDRFSEQTLSIEERQLFQTLFVNGQEYFDNGVTLFTTTHEQPSYQSGLATLTRRLMETTDSDAAISIVKMKEHVYVVARASSDRVDLRKLMDSLGGGGHAQAASATLKKHDLDTVFQKVQQCLPAIVQPALTAADLMATPVKFISTDHSIDEVQNQMYQYGHTGFPVVDEDEYLVGIISRRDVDKATHHGLGHAPVKAYMSNDPITLPTSASLEEIQSTMMKHNIGRIPILENDKMVGIISRSDVIAQLHKQDGETMNEIVKKMKRQLPPALYKLLFNIGTIADQKGVNIYLIGGIVRDILLHRSNEDIDIVIEGDGIAFANELAIQLGGKVKSHEKFGTATWKTTENVKIDIVTCRTEYYEAPAALPNVRASNIREDLRRRDFTINAMAIQINKSHFGTLLDFFQGQEDMKQQKIRILHTLSFIEDPTRIIRGVRFALRFNYQLAEQTYKLAIDAAPMLQQVSSKRLLREIELLLKEGSIIDGIQMLDNIGVWSYLIGLKTNVLTAKLTDIVKLKDPFLIFLALAYDHADWETIIQPYALTSQHRTMIQQLGIMQHIDTENLSYLSSIHQQFQPYQDEIVFIYAVLANKRHLLTYLEKRKQLPILLTGSDLIKKGLHPGPAFSDILNQLTCLQLDGEIQTKDEAFQWLDSVKNKSQTF
ncbi:CBS domain-containing protein [Alkalihalobacillus sp. MEB130]|uniref:CBS domain-containing protein n=1 Tax=Alkalihalobacillus sp. MEB130 TaxID=2976704 RepID=UPI0028DD96C2|nr:CBS domain-containing protein [Alkalihalobacillus sp. MEB130]MDT8859630.1 CBS domain-containing protein [Alkalihalobacillus sp. MEB130]